jgi:hypothetical protein
MGDGQLLGDGGGGGWAGRRIFPPSFSWILRNIKKLDRFSLQDVGM